MCGSCDGGWREKEGSEGLNGLGWDERGGTGTDQIPSPAAEGVDGLHNIAVLLAVPVAGAADDGVGFGEDEGGQEGQEGQEGG
jgi:hypothetical protein